MLVLIKHSFHRHSAMKPYAWYFGRKLLAKNVAVLHDSDVSLVSQVYYNQLCESTSFIFIKLNHVWHTHVCLFFSKSRKNIDSSSDYWVLFFFKERNNLVLSRQGYCGRDTGHFFIFLDFLDIPDFYWSNSRLEK